MLVEIYILLKGDQPKIAFQKLENEKTKIESELGYEISWEPLPENRGSRIAIYKDNADINNREDWTEQHRWLVDRMTDFRRVFAPRIRDLD